ncbi:MAG TPA: biotin--[acetyl-CoA-carboxylase] ligase [Ktedonobacterales bacterium]|nr:biotin--[acetyl-CoA-carboxylase] ligase [Ktedonobacterales bacterium]
MDNGNARDDKREIAESGAPLDVEAVRAGIVGLRLGQPFLYFPAIDSTNTYAVQLAREGATDGTLVTTDDQTAGRGRIGRGWRSLPGQQLAVSLVLRPGFSPHFLVMASALAVAETIEVVAELAADVKWPNDVQVGVRKVCGILIETSADFAVLGIGLNVNGSLAADAELAARATTLAEAASRPLAREALLIALLTRLDALYAHLSAGGMAAQGDLRRRWRARLVTLGRRVVLLQGEQTVAGMAEDVDADGALLLRRDDGTLLPVTWGDVHS